MGSKSKKPRIYTEEISPHQLTGVYLPEHCTIAINSLETNSSNPCPYTVLYPPNGLPTVSWKNLTREKNLGYGIMANAFSGTLHREGLPDKAVAIKVPHRPFQVVCLLEEARILWQVNGAGGTPKLIGITEDVPTAMVMEYIPGMVLKEYAATCTPEEFRSVYPQVRLALEELHTTGYSHGDPHLKNIIVDVENNNAIHLIDLGLATELTEENREKLCEGDFSRFTEFADYEIRRLQKERSFKRQEEF